MARLITLALLVVCLLCAGPAAAQTPGRLIVTVADPTGAIVPGATVTVVGLDDATKAAAIPAAKTNDKGVATFEGVTLGRYSIEAQFPGFDLGLVRDVRVRSGDNKHIVVLPLKKLQQTVTVGGDPQAKAADRATAFGTALTREQVDALSDDPDEMKRQLQDMAGPDAVIRVDGFEGAPLPPKAQIKSIHITRDQFAAENHYAGGVFVEIITQPGVGPLRGGGRMGYQNSALDGRNPLIPRKGPSQTQNYGMNLGGTLIKDKMDFSLGVNGTTAYSTPSLYYGTSGGTVAQLLDLRQPRHSIGGNGYLSYAFTRDQVLRFSYSQSTSTSDNQGLNGNDLPERAYSRDSHFRYLMAQEAGPLGRRFFTNTRLSIQTGESTSRSAVEAPTIRVIDDFTSGGAQVAGGAHTTSVNLSSDLDYVRGINSLRMGLQVSGAWYHSDDATNYLGTFTFSSPEAYDAVQPSLFTQRIGNPDIRYFYGETGLYIQDDLRIRKNLTLSPGVRYEFQNHMRDHNNFGPRFGVTWAPFKSGRTTLRASAGVFYDWLSNGTYEQTLRVDGFRQQELDIVNPGYPDPGAAGDVTPTNRYLLGPGLRMPRNTRLSAGFSQTLTKRISVNATYAHTTSVGILRGADLNAPANGVRPDPSFSDVIQTVDDAKSITNSLSTGLTISIAPPSPALNQATFNWRRGSLFFYYTLAKSDSNAIGTFTPPPSGTLATEWGPASNDVRHRVTMSLSSSALKHLNVNLSLTASTGMPYTITTGLDDNGDFIFNDRPAGVGRNTLRASGQWTLNGYFSYSFGFGRRPTAGLPPGIMISLVNGVAATSAMAPDTARYHMNIFVNAYNLTNHANLTGYSGVMTSPFFMKPTTPYGTRSVNFGIGFNF